MNPPNYSPKPTTPGPIEVDPTPNRAGPHHRRAHSDTSFRFSGDEDDDFLFDIDNFNLSSLDIPPSPQTALALPMAVDSSRSDESSGDNRPSSTAGPHHHHVRSLSVDADFLEEGGGERKGGGMHRRTSSMDGGSSMMMMLEGDLVMVDGVKKAMPPEKLAELALIDPKRAKRILANRQSAARSKERKIKYTSELERRVHTLQTEATTLSAQVTMLQRDTSGLTAENKELKLRLQALEQQAHLRDALNEALRQEVQRLRIATGQIPPGNDNSSGRGVFSQFPTHPQNVGPVGGSQNQPQPHQPQQPQKQQFQMPNQPSGSNPNVHNQLKSSFLDFNRV